MYIVCDGQTSTHLPLFKLWRRQCVLQYEQCSEEKLIVGEIVRGKCPHAQRTCDSVILGFIDPKLASGIVRQLVSFA